MEERAKEAVSSRNEIRGQLYLIAESHETLFDLAGISSRKQLNLPMQHELKMSTGSIDTIWPHAVEMDNRANSEPLQHT